MPGGEVLHAALIRQPGSTGLPWASGFYARTVLASSRVSGDRPVRTRRGRRAPISDGEIEVLGHCRGRRRSGGSPQPELRGAAAIGLEVGDCRQVTLSRSQQFLKL
jgi:hypothetical protein